MPVWRGRFNEAAGRTRGRHQGRTIPNPARVASMRPRVGPAEDMLPPESNNHPRPGFNEAAGRTRGRLNNLGCDRTPSNRFNEAAGRTRGRQVPEGIDWIARLASMRPRVGPAEDARPVGLIFETACCFNEAAGRTRGRRGWHSESRQRSGRFNEAAGRTRGRHRREPEGDGRGDASMRPRVGPAEDAADVERLALLVGASMRPRVGPAEDAGPIVQRAVSLAASMRPRVGPAEDLLNVNEWVWDPSASMRPRVGPAEDFNRSPARK